MKLLTLTQKVSKKLPRTRRGISLVIALTIVSIIMLQMGAMAQRNTDSIDLRRSYINTRQGYWNARSGLELALFSVTHPKEMQDPGLMDALGLTSSGENSTTKKYTINFADNSGTSWIINNANADIPQTYNENGAIATPAGVQSTSNDYHIYPFPGSGDLGGDKCDIEKMKNKEMWKKTNLVFKKEMAAMQGVNTTAPDFNPDPYQLSEVDYLDYPCFWNKLEQGKTASIPLYTESEGCTGAGFAENGVCNPKDVDMSSLIVRIRTPCKNGKIVCSPDDRRELASELDKQRVVLWDINAKCEDLNGKKKNCYFTGWQDEETEEVPNPEKKEESVIFGEELNNEKGGIHDDIDNPRFSALDTFKAYPDDLKNKPSNLEESGKPSMLNALKNASPWNTIFKNITRAKLNLSIASKLQDNFDKKIFQNLEYQILYKVGNLQNFGLTSFITNPIIIAEGYFGNFKTKLQTALSRPGGAFSYVYISQ